MDCIVLDSIVTIITHSLYSKKSKNNYDYLLLATKELVLTVTLEWMKDFENKSEISANGTRIVVFESPEISGFPEEDRRLINTYWGQSVSARLYLEDIHARAYGSNRIAFAEGLYQKIIYDRLAQVASFDHSGKNAG